MGRSLDVTVGYGVVLPWSDDSDFDFTQHPFYSTHYEDEESEILDKYSVQIEIERAYPELEMVPAYWEDYEMDWLLVIKSTKVWAYDGAVARLHPTTGLNWNALEQLKEAAELLGVPYEPSWLAVASYG